MGQLVVSSFARREDAPRRATALGSAFLFLDGPAGAAEQEEAAKLRLLLLVSAGSPPGGKDPEGPPERAALAGLNDLISRASEHGSTGGAAPGLPSVPGLALPALKKSAKSLPFQETSAAAALGGGRFASAEPF